MNFKITYTPEFLKNLRKFKKHQNILNELETKINFLVENPLMKGKNLKGKLFPNKSLRVAQKYRLIFEVKEQEIIFKAFGHRKEIYT